MAQVRDGRLKAAELWRALASAAALMLCAACATKPTPASESPAIRDFAARGYAAAATAEAATTVTSLHTWRLSGQELGVTLTLPQGSGPLLPLVIYLPGLGEAGSAGQPWRAAWAGAGYAVLSVQLLEDDLQAWKSELARAAEFKALARQRYASSAVAQRLRKLGELVAQAQRRTAAGEPHWQTIDWSRVAVAGFDLGAYTAMVLAGEQAPGLEAVAGPLSIRAAIALSPHATQAANSLDTRYADIRMPVLSVTSESDRDALGLVEVAQWRVTPFAGMPGPDKLLLQLPGLSHARIGGQAVIDNARVLPAGAPQRQGGPEAGGAGRQPSGQPSAESHALRLMAAQHISSAFLDAHVKGDAAARAWLSTDAESWLGAAGTLQRK